MAKYTKSSSLLFSVAGISLIAVAATALPSTAAYIDDDDEKAAETKQKSGHKTIRVITSGKPVKIKRSGGSYVLKSHDHDHDDDEDDKAHDHDHSKYKKGFSRSYRYTIDRNDERHENGRDAAMVQIEKSLETVEKRLAKARKKSEKNALKAARDGLQTAIKALKERRMHRTAFGGGHRSFAFLHGGPASVQVEIDGEMSNLRDVIDGALGDIDIDIDTDTDMDVHADIHREIGRDGDVRILHLNKPLHGKHWSGQNDEKKLEDMKRAEEELRKIREKLEKRLLEKKEKADDKD